MDQQEADGGESSAGAVLRSGESGVPGTELTPEALN